MAGRHIVAMGGGGFSMEPENPLLDDFVLSLTGKARPVVCFLPTASGDSSDYLVNFYRAFAGRAEATDLALFRRSARDVGAVLRAADVIYVGGGNTASMLAIWRRHGVDQALRDAWAGGVVLAGVSAGAVCWFQAGVTDSFGPELASLDDCLGLVAGSFCPHYDGETARRPAFHRLIGAGLPAGHAADDGAALHIRDGDLVEAIASRPGARAYRVSRTPAGTTTETELPTRYLG